MTFPLFKQCLQPQSGWHYWEQRHLFKFVKQAFDRHASSDTITSLNELLAYLASTLWSILFEKVKRIPAALDSSLLAWEMFSISHWKEPKNVTAYFVCLAFADWKKWQWALIYHTVMRRSAETDEFLRIVFLSPCYIILFCAVFSWHPTTLNPMEDVT